MDLCYEEAELLNRVLAEKKKNPGKPTTTSTYAQSLTPTTSAEPTTPATSTYSSPLLPTGEFIRDRFVEKYTPQLQEIHAKVAQQLLTLEVFVVKLDMKTDFGNMPPAIFFDYFDNQGFQILYGRRPGEILIRPR